MKKSIFTLLVVLIVQTIAAQEIQNQVIGSGGDVNLVGNTIVSWTIGECITDRLCGADYLVTQGFHQSFYKILRLPESRYPLLNVKVYPNPTSGLLNLDLSVLSPCRKYQVILSNADGKILLRQEIPSGDIFQFNLLQFQDGLMILKVMEISGASQSSFRIMKINH